ncbi:copper-translocating P-type ATPase [Diaporthe helianthi]|uniref:Copper-translocating P-type ATPase n=1 Tax=Diaporthe helianthi TaxID=158607 RepID=A0A2P5I8C3_DIAHE|nr:copper-translocating P-type ATPase [Diaporthe helianthi]
MACGSGCCAPSEAPTTIPPPQQQPRNEGPSCCGAKDVEKPKATVEVETEDSCGDGCCSGSEPPKLDAIDPGATCKDACCAEDEEQPKSVTEARSKDTCGDGCCSGDEPPKKTESKAAATCEDACCAGDMEQPEAAIEAGPNDTCGGGCCSEDEPLKKTESKASAICENTCCAGDDAVDMAKYEPGASCNDPCCDDKKPEVEDPESPTCCKGKSSVCCDVSCLDRLAARECAGQPEDQSSKGSCDKGRDGKPCGQHSQSTRQKYAAKLEALGCLCRALLAMGQDSCCPPPKRTSLERRRCSKQSSSTTRRSVDSCCATGAATASSLALRARARGRDKPCGQNAAKKPQKDDCADKDCCATTTTTTRLAADCIYTKGRRQGNEQTIDLETGLSGKEHVILSISGMTCTGCETKLKRTLASLESVKNLKTSLVLSRAEFDLDSGTVSVADVVKHLERTTEFKCERVTNKGSNIDIMTPGDAIGFVNDNWPLGVTDATVVGKNVMNVAFDAKVVGPRDLLEKGWDAPMKLAPPRGDQSLAAGSKHVRNVGLSTLLSAILTIPVLVLAWAPLPERELAYGSASLALATLVQVVIAGPFYPKALKALVFSRVIEMDLLIVLSTSAAYIFSVVSFGYLAAGQPLSTGEFFETSTLLVTLIMVGRYVAALARQKAVESISIRSLQAPTAILVGDEEREVDVRLLQYGDTFKVLPDSKIPTDGTVVSGSSEVDESMVTGESRPVEKYTKSAVIAGSINGAGTLIVRLNRLPGDNTISAIANMVDQAKLSKPKIQDIADRVASYFVPVIVCLTMIVFCIWIAVGIAVQGRSGSDAVIQAVTYAITVLIVSCPCAIGLAVPMVIVISSGVAAERGVIIKSADPLEVAYKASHVVLDKTGTLTQGQLTVARELWLGDQTSLAKSKASLLSLLLSNKHPVSATVASQLQSTGVTPTAKTLEASTLTGKGVEAITSSGSVLRAGNSRWLGLSQDSRVQPVLSEGHTTFCFTVDDALVAVFGLQDSLRPESMDTVEQLHKRGVAVHVISGDDDAAVRSVTNQLSIPDDRVRSRCTPADKQAYIQDLLSAPHGKSPPTVIFCGDGTNDAVALAQATIGVHMNDSSGTDVAKSAADVVLMRPSLAGILTLINASKKSMGRVAFNFGWSFVYNILAILLGGGAFSGLHNARIPPEFAGLGELVSVVPVIAAAMLLRWEKI